VVLAGGGKDISAAKVSVLSATEITCEFDLNGAASGTYSVKVTNDDGKSASLTNVFQVSQASTPTPTIAPTPEPTSKPKPTTVPTPTPPVNRQLSSIFFDFDKSVLRSDQTGTMENNLAVLKNNPQMYIILGGHASERGTREYNMALSAHRADTVKKYLIDAGIAPEQISVYAYGEDHPLKNGHDEASRSYNRRVDILMWDTTLSEEQVLAETIK
jgi:peptidoglycan-associated lipoprotein